MSLTDLEIVVLRMLEQAELKMLLIDETHNILASTYNDQRAMLNLLRFISNELRVSIVCFGVDDAKEAISGDVQLACRFQEYYLLRWQADESFQSLVAGILRNIPLRLPSILSTRALKRILQMSGGVTSKIFAILSEAAELAIRSERERIDDDLRRLSLLARIASAMVVNGQTVAQRGLDCGRELLGGALKLTASLLDEVIGFVQGLDDLDVDVGEEAFLG